MPKFVLFAVLFVPTVLFAEWSSGYPVPSAELGRGAAKAAARLPKNVPYGKIPRDLRGITHNDLGPQVAERLRNVSRDSDPFLYEMYRSIEIPMAEIRDYNDKRTYGKKYETTVLGGKVYNKFYSNLEFSRFGNTFFIQPKENTFLSLREDRTETKTVFLVPFQEHNETYEITYNLATLRVARIRTYVLGDKTSEKLYEFVWDDEGQPDHLAAANMIVSLNGKKVKDPADALEDLEETYKKATRRNLIYKLPNVSGFWSQK